MKFIKRIIEQYITCKHEDYEVIRKIICLENNGDFKSKWMERRRCKVCSREYYSDYFYEYGKKRHYIK